MAGAVGAAAFLAAAAWAAPANAIIGGTDATEEYPFMVSLSDDKGVHYCGGALIDKEWLVTAGHCTAGDAEQITARVGSADNTSGGSERGIAQIVTHPDYTADPENLRSDIALIRLDAPVEERPIGIAAESGAPGSTARIMGWGMTCEDGSECPNPPQILQELDTEIAADDRCTGIDGAGDICSEHPTREAQSCSNDSGGPMVQGGPGRWELVGATSRDGDAETDPSCVGPGVWTDVPAHADWIRATVGA
ncbi:trypsin [Murinocardiopsis flavida]|uniref:Trypsin n=1 Tax=Murinocardiopsis flavida TaxID=645275 RepID=A0A2P8DKH9_9ACTN|nr:serine protease [Murinocardiopsis flavida]PSK97709.1 trypsin [Murinocardiopsis flavida]